jgi:RimJ/RimL family protein N-acetyltransferase
LYLTYVLPINEVAQSNWFEQISRDGTKMYMAIESKAGKFLGVARVDEWDKINRSIRIGIDIVKSEREKGYATEAYLLMFEFFFEQIGINRIWLEVADFNKPALSLYKKNWFCPRRNNAGSPISL